MKKHIFTTTIALFFSLISINNYAQNKQDIDFKTITKAKIESLSYDVLLEMPLADLKQLAEIADLTTNELLQLALNQEVSSVSKKGESVFESPLSTSVISKEEIILSGATNLEEALRLVQGLIVREESNGNFDIHIRGNDNVPPGNMSHFSENTLTLVMIDNRIAYNYINGGTMWESLPVGLSDIERIEIVRGPSSSLYGPNAVSGVINIITKQPNEKGTKVYGDIQSGNYNVSIGSVALLSKINEKIRFKISQNFDFRDRTYTDFYEFLRNKYRPADSLISMFGNIFEGKSTNPTLSKKAHSTKAGIYYSPTEKISCDLNMGYQNSQSQSVFFENLATPFSIRSSETVFADFKAQGYGVSIQVNSLFGNQNLHEMMLKPVIHYDFTFTTGNIEYDICLNKIGIGDLRIRPGISFQQAKYDDKKYIEQYRADLNRPELEGLLNGEKELNTKSANIRIDYKPISKLRFIGSIRGDKFNYPDKIYYSYQAGISYNINNSHMIRFVSSKAYRSPFMGDVYADFKNLLMMHMGMPLYQVYAGFQSEFNQNACALPSQTLQEFGYRAIITDNIHVDLEIFNTITENFTALLPSKRELFINNGQPEILDIWEYQNMTVKAKQNGISGSVSLSPANKLNIKLFGTYQETVLNDFTKIFGETILIDTAAKNTPAFYGGLTINYSFIDKWNINMSLYCYSEQTYTRYRFNATTNNHTSMETKIDPNFITNIKISYRVFNNSTVFFNFKNILDSKKIEFGYADKMRRLILIGTNFNF